MLKPVPVPRSRLLLGLTLCIASACTPAATGMGSEAVVEMRDGQPVAMNTPTPLYSADFVIRGMAADGEHLYVSGLRMPSPGEGEGEGGGEDAPPTGVIIKAPLLGVPEVLAEGAFVPMTKLALVDGKLYWHERHDSPDGRGLRALSIAGGEIEHISELSGHSWLIEDDYFYFTRPDDEIDEGGFYVLERGVEGAEPKLVVRRRGVVRTLLASEDGSEIFWTTRQRRNGTWGVMLWDGNRKGKEVLRSDETFASMIVDGEDFVWVTWAEDEGQPLHSLYRRPIADPKAQVEVLARKHGLPGFMEVFADDRHVYLTTVQGGELRRLPKTGGEVEILEGSGDRKVVDNTYNLFWVDEQRIFWMGK